MHKEIKDSAMLTPDPEQVSEADDAVMTLTCEAHATHYLPPSEMCNVASERN